MSLMILRPGDDAFNDDNDFKNEVSYKRKQYDKVNGGAVDVEVVLKFT